MVIIWEYPQNVFIWLLYHFNVGDSLCLHGRHLRLISWSIRMMIYPFSLIQIILFNRISVCNFTGIGCQLRLYRNITSIIRLDILWIRKIQNYSILYHAQSLMTLNFLKVLQLIQPISPSSIEHLNYKAAISSDF